MVADPLRPRRIPRASSELLARRTAGITGSLIDSSMTLLQTQTHDVVRLAMGSPGARCIPTATFDALLAQEAGNPDSFDYAPSEGDSRLRSALTEFLAAHYQPVSPQELLITIGGMQGIDLVCKLFIDPGDLVAVESPTYTNGTATITGYQGRILEVPADSDGMDVDSLVALVTDEPRPPKLIYTIPTFQNPAGTTLSLARRERLLELAAGWGSIILEDSPYDMLRFHGRQLPSLIELADGTVRVIGVYTFSKILAPGLRVGWVVAEPPVIELMVRARQAMDTCTNTLQQRLVAGFLASGSMEPHLELLRSEYGYRKQAMQQALRDELAHLGATWTDPDGGFFLWVTLPDGLDTRALFPLALEEGVAFVPGPAFSAAGRFANALRLAFSAEDPARVLLGVQRLRRAIDRWSADTRLRGRIATIHRQYRARYV